MGRLNYGPYIFDRKVIFSNYLILLYPLWYLFKCLIILSSIEFYYEALPCLFLYIVTAVVQRLQ